MSKTDPTFDAIKRDLDICNEVERKYAECEEFNPGLGSEQLEGLIFQVFQKPATGEGFVRYRCRKCGLLDRAQVQ